MLLCFCSSFSDDVVKDDATSKRLSKDSRELMLPYKNARMYNIKQKYTTFLRLVRKNALKKFY